MIIFFSLPDISNLPPHLTSCWSSLSKARKPRRQKKFSKQHVHTHTHTQTYTICTQTHKCTHTTIILKEFFSFKDKQQKQGFISYCSHYNRIPDKSNFRVGGFSLAYGFRPLQGGHWATTCQTVAYNKAERTRSGAGFNSQHLPFWPTCVNYASCSKVPESPRMA